MTLGDQLCGNVGLIFRRPLIAPLKETKILKRHHISLALTLLTAAHSQTHWLGESHKGHNLTWHPRQVHRLPSTLGTARRGMCGVLHDHMTAGMRCTLLRELGILFLSLLRTRAVNHFFFIDGCK